MLYEWQKVSNLSKIVRIVTNCEKNCPKTNLQYQKGGQVISPHPSDKISLNAKSKSTLSQCESVQ